MEYNCNVRIIDMIMGSGKTASMINYINQSDDNCKFLFITPYLDEVQRIQDACPSKHFKDPKAIGGRKLNGIKSLIDKGENIISTHSLFQRFDRELIDMCRAKNYILIMDEVADVIERYDITSEDFDLLINNFVDIDESTGFMNWRESAGDYNGKFSAEKRLCELHCLAYYGGTVMMWLFPIEVFNAFRNIYILTYMFDYQLQRYYYDFFGLPYTHIYVGGNSIENYYITNDESEVQPVVINYRNLIHIIDDVRMNSIGDREYDLSKSWYQRNANNTAIKQLKNNLINFFIRKRQAKSGDCIWTTFKDYRNKLTTKGFGRAFLPSNTRASNKYRTRTSVAYPINKYINTGVKNFFIKNGVEVDEDGYALSEMLQFIWRSAIRDGKEIWIYIPSIRMRTLLENWIEENSAADGSVS